MTLKTMVLEKAKKYDAEYINHFEKGESIKMKSPTLFVLFGDQVAEGIKEIKSSMLESIVNAEGAIYLVISKKPIEEHLSNTVYLTLPMDEAMDERGKIGELLSQEDFLRLLGTTIIEVKKKIMAQSKVFSYWEQINICTVTAASDRINCLLPDIMILLRTKLAQDFKQVLMDLFVRLEETGCDSEPLNQALAASFFKELDTYQQADFHYERPLEVLEDHLTLNVSYNQPIFHLVYILSDKKQNGQQIINAHQQHYRTIVSVLLLRNREQPALELEEAREQYNHNVFMSNIKEQGENRYCTAHLAYVKKPGVGIYLAVIHHLLKAYKQELSGGSDEEIALLSKIGITDKDLEELMIKCMPQEERLSQIHSLISRNMSFREIKSASFREAEKALYGDSVSDFFKVNFEKVGLKQVEDYLLGNQYKESLVEQVITNPCYGPYSLTNFFKAESLSELEGKKEAYLLESQSLEMQRKEKAETIISTCISSKLGLFDKKSLYEVKEYLIEEIYHLKYKALEAKLKAKAIEVIKQVMTTLYEQIKNQLQKLDTLEDVLAQLVEEVNRYEEEYLVQNVNEYYQGVVKACITQLKENEGKDYFHSKEMMGPIGEMLKLNLEEVLDKLVHIAQDCILNETRYFNVSFEEELLARANMVIDYEDKEVVAKRELYDLLYSSLEESSKPCVHLDTTVSTHCYLEKYFFGSRQSEFIDYAYKKDQTSRNYKIGTVSDSRKSSIEKLQLMGGFKLQDLVFTSSAMRYYEAYKDKNYHFHTKEVEA